MILFFCFLWKSIKLSDLTGFQESFANEVNSALANREQHDPQEFLIYLLDALHEDTNRV